MAENQPRQPGELSTNKSTPVEAAAPELVTEPITKPIKPAKELSNGQS